MQKNERIVAAGGVRIPTSAAAGRLAVSNASGDVTWTDPATVVASALTTSAAIYRMLLIGGTRLTASSAAGTKYAAVPSTADVASGVLNPAANSAHAGTFLTDYVAADHALSGLTTKLRLRAFFQAQNTAPGVTITVGLYPVTIGTSVLNLGTVVTGSAVTFTTPAANTLTPLDSGDFTPPADGLYTVGYIVSGVPAAGASFQHHLQVHNV